MQQWTKDDLALLNMTNEVDYDQDGMFPNEYGIVVCVFSSSNVILGISPNWNIIFSLLSTAGGHDRRKNWWVYRVERKSEKFQEVFGWRRGQKSAFDEQKLLNIIKTNFLRFYDRSLIDAYYIVKNLDNFLWSYFYIL